MKSRYPIFAGLLLGALGCSISLTGYGYVLYYLRLPLLVIPLGLAAPALLRKDFRHFVVNTAVITALALCLWYAGTVARRIYYNLSVCHEMNTAITLAKAFHKEMGRYPTNLTELAYTPPAGTSIQSQRMSSNGINLNGMNDFDATLYLTTNDFACVVPVTKVLPMSITRFYVYRWTTAEPNWVYDKIIWVIGKF